MAEADAGRVGIRSRPKMLWDLSSLAVGQLLSMVLGFVGFAYLARTLSPASYGLVDYAVGLTGLAAIVIEGGTGPIGTLHVSRDPQRARQLAANLPMARLILAVAVVPLVGLSSMVNGFDRTVSAMIWLFALSLFAIPFKQDWLLQGLDRMTLVAPAQVLKSGAFALGVYFVVRGDFAIARIGLIEAAAAFLAAAYLVAAQRMAAVPLRLDVRRSPAWELIRAGASIGASNMLWPFMAYAPILLVTNLAGSADAAWLGAAHRIVVALVSFSALYFFNLYPLLGRGLREDRGQWTRLMASSFRLIAWASIGFALATTLVANTIVTTVFGQPFVVAGPVLAVAIWILPLRLLSGHARWTLLAAERQGALLIAEIVCAAAIVAISIALIPRYGALGGALAGVGGNILGWTLAHVLARRHVGPLPGAPQVLLPATGAILAAALAWIIPGHEWTHVALAMMVYVLYMRLTASDLTADAIRLAHAKRTVTSSDGR
jgi:O-antigen/teichoic acid export membrane protein